MIVKCNGFTNAAKIVHSSQSALSRNISALETKLGFKLFYRKCRAITLTAEGKELFQIASRMFNEIASYQELHTDSDTLTGELKLSIDATLPTLKLEEYLAAFLQEYPLIKLRIQVENELSLVGTSITDASIRQFDEKDDTLHQIYLTSIPLGLYASSFYLEQFGRPQEIKDLSQHCFMGVHEGKESSAHPLNGALSLTKQSRSSVSTNSYATLIKAAEQGLGIACLTEREGNSNGLLERVLPHQHAPLLDLYYVYPKHRQKAKRITVLGDFLQKKLKLSVA